MSTKTIVLIHGLSVSYHSWEAWVEHYQGRGFKVVAIPYPGRDKPLKVLQQNPNDPILSTITLPQVIDHLVKTIKSLDEKPIIMGHSFGGMLTQLMLHRDLAVSAVAIDGAPPMGVLPTQWSFLRSALPAFNPFVPASKPWYMTFEQFQYAWVHTMPLAEQRVAYDAVIVPESRTLYRSALTKAAAVDFQRRRAPLLMIAGEKDHIIPAALNRANYKRYAKSPSVTEYKEYPGRTHYTIVSGKGWEDIADYALDWALRAVQEAPRPVSVGAQLTSPAPAS